MDTFRDKKKESLMEAVNWVCANTQDDHDWVSETFLVVHENEMFGELDYSVEVLSIVHRGFLWYSAPCSSHRYIHPDVSSWDCRGQQDTLPRHTDDDPETE